MCTLLLVMSTNQNFIADRHPSFVELAAAQKLSALALLANRHVFGSIECRAQSSSINPASLLRGWQGQLVNIRHSRDHDVDQCLCDGVSFHLFI